MGDSTISTEVLTLLVHCLLVRVDLRGSGGVAGLGRRAGAQEWDVLREGQGLELGEKHVEVLEVRGEGENLRLRKSNW